MDGGHGLQVRVDLDRAVADDALGNTLEHAEVLGVAIEFRQLAQVAVRVGRFAQQSDEHRGDLRVEILGDTGFEALLDLGGALGDEVADLMVGHGVVETEQGSLALFPFVPDEIPVGQHLVFRGAQLVGFLDGFELADGGIDVVEFGEQIAERDAPVGVCLLRADPREQRLLQVGRAVERYQQAVVAAPPDLGFRFEPLLVKSEHAFD